MLETLREYAASQVESEEARRLAHRHFNHFLALAENTAEHVAKGQSSERLEAEQDNLRAALHYALKSEANECGEMRATQGGARLVLALRSFWELHCQYDEALSWTEKALEQDEISPSTRAHLLGGAAESWWHVGRFDKARERAQQGLALARQLDHGTGVLAALNSAARAAITRGEAEEARAMIEESLALNRALGDERNVLLALINRGWMLLDTLNPSPFLPQLEETLLWWHASYKINAARRQRSPCWACSFSC